MRADSTRRRTAWVVLAMLVLMGSLAGPAMAAAGPKKPPTTTTLAALADRLEVSAQTHSPAAG